MIETITPINFRSFGLDTKPITLGKLNILIGANGSGKTNFLRWCRGDRDENENHPFEYLNCDSIPALRRVMEDDAMRERLCHYLRNYSWGFSNLSIDASDRIFITENTVRRPLSQYPKSLSNMIGLLAALFDPAGPELVLIDDLCAGFHLDLHSTLVDMLEEASERKQIIATTHAETVLDALTHKPECFYVTEKDKNGYTQITRLDPKELAPWLEKYSLGNLWASGQIGGNRW